MIFKNCAGNRFSRAPGISNTENTQFIIKISKVDKIMKIFSAHSEGYSIACKKFQTNPTFIHTEIAYFILIF